MSKMVKKYKKFYLLQRVGDLRLPAGGLWPPVRGSLGPLTGEIVGQYFREFRETLRIGGSAALWPTSI